jgi:hypothetical protein
LEGRAAGAARLSYHAGRVGEASAATQIKRGESDRMPAPAGESALVSRSGSSMRKSFALCEAFGLTPFGPRAPAARRGSRPPSPRPGSRAHARGSPPASCRRHSRPWRRAAPRGEDLKEAGGRRPPASFKTSPLPRLDSLLRTLTRAGGGVRGGGGGRPRPFGMLPWRGREAARRDHQPQLVYEPMTRDTRSVMKRPWYLRGTVLFSGEGALPSPC